MSFGNSSQATEILMQTLCPTWDQTLIFENVPIYGNTEGVQDDPPHIVLEFFDRDAVVSLCETRSIPIAVVGRLHMAILVDRFIFIFILFFKIWATKINPHVLSVIVRS